MFFAIVGRKKKKKKKTQNVTSGRQMSHQEAYGPFLFHDSDVIWFISFIR